MAWRGFFTLPALPPGPLFSSPCVYSCMTRPIVLRWDIEVLAMSWFLLMCPLPANDPKAIRLRCMTSAYLAPERFVDQLREELRRAHMVVIRQHERLLICEGEAIEA